MIERQEEYNEIARQRLDELSNTLFENGSEKNR